MPIINSISLCPNDGSPRDMAVNFETSSGYAWFRVGSLSGASVSLHIHAEHWDHFRSEMLMALRVADEHYAPLLGRKSEGNALQEESLAREAEEVSAPAAYWVIQGLSGAWYASVRYDGVSPTENHDGPKESLDAAYARANVLNSDAEASEAYRQYHSDDPVPQAL